MSRLYNERSTFFLKNQISFNRVTEEYREYLYDNFDWMENLNQNLKDSEEVFNYFYASKKHRRNLVKLRAYFNRYEIQISTIKDQSLLCYLVIRDIINDTSEFPEVIKNYGLQYATNTVEDFIGNYIFDNDTTQIHKIEKKYNVLILSWPNQQKLYSEGLILREYGKDSLGFISTNVYPMKFLRDDNNKVNGFKGYDINDTDNWVEAIKINE